MTRQAASLLEATERDSGEGENRLTEIFAAVLQAVPELADALMENLRLPLGEQYDVSTQVTADGSFIDMEVLAIGPSREVVTRVWAEHKVHAKFGPRQMAKYGRLLQDRPASRHALVGIVLNANAVEEGSPKTTWRTWQDIAVLADEVGRQRDGSRWRSTSRSPDAPATQLILLEFLEALERKDVAHMDPLDPFDIAVLSKAVDSRDKLEALIARALGNLDGTDFEAKKERGSSGRSMREIGDSWHTINSPQSWVDQYGGWGEVATRWWDDFVPQDRQLEAPCLGAGFSLDLAPETRLLAESEDLKSWRDTLAKKSIFLTIEGKFVRLWAVRYLSDILSAGATLDPQAQAVSNFVRRTVQAIVDLPPANKGTRSAGRRRTARARR